MRIVRRLLLAKQRNEETQTAYLDCNTLNVNTIYAILNEIQFTLIHYPIPPHKQECYASAPWNIGLQLPVTEQIAAHELSLPIGPTVKTEDVAYIIDLINRF